MMRKKETSHLFAKDITGEIVKGRQEVVINWRAGQLLMDEPSFNGGKDIGPDPFTAVLSGLVACTLTTLRMYVRKKGWDISDIHVAVNMQQRREPFQTLIDRTLFFGQPVSEEQRERLLYIAKNCPVARLLQGEILIDTDLSADKSVRAGRGTYPPIDHEAAAVTQDYPEQL
jgi:putative redox protein